MRPGSVFLLATLLQLGCGSEAELGPDGGELKADGGSVGSDAAPDASGEESLPPDLCAALAAPCPSTAGLVEGAGLVSIESCAFPMQARDRWQETGALIDSLAQVLPVVGVADVLGDLNRSGQASNTVPGNPPGLQQAFLWQSGDQNVEYWIPQGITSSADAFDGGQVNGKAVAMVSWYYDQAKDPGSTQAKGVRIAIADTSDPENVSYRFVLLAEPALVDGRASYKSVRVHAGGLAWVGNYLYVVHTGVGLRIFDLERMLKVSTGKDMMGYDAASDQYYAHNYSYVLPQVETIAQVSECAPRFSFLSLDRSTTPPSLLTGEYDSASVAGRLYRLPLQASSGKPALVEGMRLYPSEAFLMGQSHVQGALSVDNSYWLSSSKPAQGAGVLYRTGPDIPTSNRAWNDSPEDLAYDPQRDSVWSLSEGLGARYVFRVARGAID